MTKSSSDRLPKQSTLTGLAACLFAGAVLDLFLALYHDADRGGPLLWTAGLLLAATIACWIASARALGHAHISEPPAYEDDAEVLKAVPEGHGPWRL